MKTSKKILIPTIALSIFTVAAVAGAGSAFAGEHTTIAQKLAERFGLNVSEVQQVFEEQRDERQVKRSVAEEIRLNKLVEVGKITQEQKDLLVNKFEEKRVEKEAKREARIQNKEEVKNMTDEERKAQREENKKEMKAEREEMDKWFEDNGIDQKLFRNGNDHHRGGSGGRK